MTYRRCRKGAALLISMIVLAILSAWAVSIYSMSGAAVQLVENQRKIDSALSAAQSGLECGKYIVEDTLNYLLSTGNNHVTDDEAEATWNTLCARVQAQPWVAEQATQTSNEIITPAVNFGAANASFQVRFYRDDTLSIRLEGVGADGQVKRQVSIDMTITKDSSVLNYAIASRGRMWLTRDSTIHGDIFSSWHRTDISPFNMTSDSRVEGTINTVLTLDEIENAGAFQMETLDENGNPMFDFDSDPVFEPMLDENGDPIFDPFNYRVYSPDDDEIQGYHRNINYDQLDEDDMPGMDIADYDTDEYADIVVGGAGNGDIPSSSTIETEYFPHAAGDYTLPESYASRQLNRHVYENQTFTNVRLPDNRNALFRNCTFEEVLYIDCSESGYYNYNNVRFDNCTFNGIIVTDVPQRFRWKYNCLYFTGEAAFNNTSEIQEATILAPHFNVNLGNTNPVASDNNVLTGAIVGGIVDVRGNAQIYGTIISMCDTSIYDSGYVTNIGATDLDGGSETTEPGDVGVISITPEEDKMLPSGITSPIIIKPLQNTYSEGF